MMNEINLSQAAKLTSPNPVSIICTEKPDGETNLATVSWWTYLSFRPGLIAYVMSKTSYSGEMVRDKKKVILTIPGSAISEKVKLCGSSTGRNTNKVKQFGIEMQQISGSNIKIPLHSRVAIQCELKEFIEVEDHYLYICNVEQVYGNEKVEAVFAWNGYAEIRPV